MSDTTIRLKIKIEGDDSLKDVEVSAEELAKAFVDVKDKVHELNEKLLNVNQISQAFEQVGAMVQGLRSVMNDLTDAYAVQAAAETRLEQMMRNTMDATDAEIQSIKDLAAEQQKLGVIGDEIILSGAQELATYMQKKESLESLIPVMNDMIAQQYGYNASAEGAVGVAQMMGKVFTGEVGALKRLGYTFDEAQEQILKFGTEEEKVATLTEVVGQIVDGTNAKLAATPYGQIAKFRNDLGDIKEELGRIVAPAMNAVDSISKLTIAIAGIGKGTAAIKGVIVAIQSMRSNLTKATVAQHGLNAAMKANVIIAVVSAVAALVAVLVKLAQNSRDAAGGMEELKEANEAYKSAASNAKAEIDTEIAALKNLMDQGKDTTYAIQKLNEKYGEAFGYHQTAADWYDTLTKKSKIYCAQIGYEAKAKALSSKIANLEIENDEKKRRKRELESRPTTKAEGREYKQLGKDIADNIKKIEELNADREKAFNESNRLQAQLNGTTKEGAKAVAWQSMTYEALGKAIQEQAKKVKESIAANNGLAEAEAATLNAMQQRYDAIGKQFDKLTGKVKNLNTEIRGTAGLLPSLAPIGATTSIETPEPTYANPKPLKGLFDFRNLGEFEQRLTELENIRKQVSQDQLPIIDAQIALVRQLKDEFEGVNQTVAASPLENFAQGWGGIKGIGNSIRDIKSALTETDNAWDALTQTVDGFISLFQSMQQVVEVINTITAVTKAMQATSDAATNAHLTNATKDVAANTAVAGSGAASSMASIPYVGPVLAIAAMASVIAALASLPKFANGGLVYGPTLGLMGEYGGASSNPEVIAPLSRLRSLLGEGGGTGRSEVKFRIEGRELVGIMNKQNNIYRRSN